MTVPRISVAQGVADLAGVRDMAERYLRWDLAELEKVSGMVLDPEDYLANTFDDIESYFPPSGRILLARDPDGGLLGMAFLKPIGPDACEIKRMYVEPAARGLGLGRALLNGLIEAAAAIGYREAWLDSAVYMPAAHALYRSVGFEPAEYYPEGENDPVLAPYLVYMRRAL